MVLDFAVELPCHAVLRLVLKRRLVCGVAVKLLRHAALRVVLKRRRDGVDTFLNKSIGRCIDESVDLLLASEMDDLSISLRLVSRSSSSVCVE